MKRLGDKKRRRLRETRLGRKTRGDRVVGKRGLWVDAEIRGAQRSLEVEWQRAQRLMTAGGDPAQLLGLIERIRRRLDELSRLVRDRSS
jgi:hypothetical protein